MKDIFEIRVHGRGGQGAKTATIILAEAAMNKGKHIQAFPEYGAERQGAPIRSYTRISDKKMTIHCGVTNPDVVAVIDPTLLKSIPVAEGLTENGILLANTIDSPDEVRKIVGFNTGKVYTFDATGISQKHLGRNLPNMPLLGAVLKIAELDNIETLKGINIDDIKSLVEHKFRRRYGQDIVNKNNEAIMEAYNEVK